MANRLDMLAPVPTPAAGTTAAAAAPTAIALTTTPPIPAGEREVRFEVSSQFVSLLDKLNVSLLVSSRRSGKVVAIGRQASTAVVTSHLFDQPTGLGMAGDRIAVACRDQVWVLRDASELASQWATAGRFDALFAARTSFLTGAVNAGEILYSKSRWWFINTRFSCLCTLSDDYNFVPQWRPRFIRELAAEDRCHLSGFSLADGKPRYMTAYSETDSAEGWRNAPVGSGCLMDLKSGDVLSRGFCMPHSPRYFRDKIWLLDSGTGRLMVVPPDGGVAQAAGEFPGFVRGLAFHDTTAFVGLSKPRLGVNIPLANRPTKSNAAVIAVDLWSGRPLAKIEFVGGLDEIDDVLVLPGKRCPTLRGPLVDADPSPTIWCVPQ